MRGVKKHLKVMEEKGLIVKEPKPGSANTLYIDEGGLGCYEYLCDLISLSASDERIAKDVQALFSRGRNVVEKMVGYYIPHVTRYITDIVSQEMRDKWDDQKILESDDVPTWLQNTHGGRYARSYSISDGEELDIWKPNDEITEIIRSFSCESPTLFSVGAQRKTHKINRMFLPVIRMLIGSEKIPTRSADEYFKWLAFYLIAASLITDHDIFQMNIWRDEREESRKKFDYFEDIGDLREICNKNTRPIVYGGATMNAGSGSYSKGGKK